MNLEKLKDSARKYEQKEDWRKAIEVYLKAIQQIESGAETSPDLSLYNRVGDLYLRISDTASAVRSYERAVDLYADQGFFNNAIALCGKILRVNPGRTQTYLKLAQLHARKNVVIEAKRNLLEFLERMHGIGQLEQAFRSVKEFADRFSGSVEIRMMLVDLLRAASRGEQRRELLDQMVGDLEAHGGTAGPGPVPEEPAVAPPEPSPEPTEPLPAGRRGDLIFLDTGISTFPPAAEGRPGRRGVPADPPPEGLMVSSAVEPGPDSLSDPLPLEGLEQVEEIEFLPPSLSDDEGAGAGAGELPPTALGLEPSEPASLDFEGGLADGGDAPPILIDLDASEPVELEPEAAPSARGGGELEFIPIAPDPSQLAGPPIPLADLEDRVLEDPDDPDAHRDLAGALLAADQAERAMEELTLALSGYEARADWAAANEVSAHLVALSPDNIRFHQKRVEIAFRTGDRPPLIDAYLALGDALHSAGAADKAAAVYTRVQEHDPGNRRARAALARLSGPMGRPEPAGTAQGWPGVPVRPVVPSRPMPASAAGPATAQPELPAARAARPEALPAGKAPPTGKAPPRAVEQPGDFVDLGSLVLEPEPRDTRMRIERGEPANEDEEREFAEILEQFKRGIEQNLDSEDYQAHYDLGVAFKEMGLLDEAIAEFQKALRAPEGAVRLRVSEALGAAFYDQGQFALSEKILSRAISGLDGGDDAKVGLLYWLGRAGEAQGKTAEAIATYERALAVDIRFKDLGDRLRRLSAGHSS